MNVPGILFRDINPQWQLYMVPNPRVLAMPLC